MKFIKITTVDDNVYVLNTDYIVSLTPHYTNEAHPVCNGTYIKMYEQGHYEKYHISNESMFDIMNRIERTGYHMGEPEDFPNIGDLEYLEDE